MKHKSTKYKEDGTPREFVLAFKPSEIAALYAILGSIQFNHLEENLAGIEKDRLFDLVSELGNIGNADYEDGWRDVVRSRTEKWIPVEKAGKYVVVDLGQ